MQCPAWVLARKEAVKPEFVMTWPVDEYDVLNRWRMWHICYDVVSSSSPGPDAVVVWVGDDRGETGHVRVFEDVGGWKEGMEMICAYGREIAGRWNLEWRLSVCRAGIMAKEELQGKMLPKAIAKTTANKNFSLERYPQRQNLANYTFDQ